jgi:hypothetical protein
VYPCQESLKTEVNKGSGCLNTQYVCCRRQSWILKITTKLECIHIITAKLECQELLKVIISTKKLEIEVKDWGHHAV